MVGYVFTKYNHSNNYILDYTASCHLIYCIHGLALWYLLLLTTRTAPTPQLENLSTTIDPSAKHLDESGRLGSQWRDWIDWYLVGKQWETFENWKPLKAKIGCFRNLELWSFETILCLPFQWNKIIHLRELVQPTLSRLEGTPGLPGSRLDACWANRN